MTRTRGGLAAHSVAAAALGLMLALAKRQPQKQALVRAGTWRSEHGETSEALFLTSGYTYDSAQTVADRFAGEGYASVDLEMWDTSEARPRLAAYATQMMFFAFPKPA